MAAAFTGYAEFTVTGWSCGGLLVVLAQAMDYVTPMLGTKYSGGSQVGKIGDVPWEPWPAYSCFRLGESCWVLRGGLSWGNFLGGKASGDALKAGFGAFAGFFIECRAEGYPLRLFYL